MVRTRRLETACPANSPKGGSRSVMTLDRFVSDQYLPYMRLRKRSWEMDERVIRRYVSPVLGFKAIAKISAADIADWQGHLLKAGFSPSSCNRFLSTLKTVFALAESRELIPASPCKGIRQLKDRKPRERYLTLQEGRMLLERLAEIDSPQARALELILFTGARKSEIMKARWENISFDKRLLTVPVSKSGNSRRIILSDRAIARLKSISRLPGCPWVFPAKNPEQPIRDLYPFWNALRTELGLRDVRIHDLRHSFASYLVNSGHSLYEIQKLLGHADPRTTMRYAHLDISSLVRAVESVSCGLLEDKGELVDLES